MVVKLGFLWNLYIILPRREKLLIGGNMSNLSVELPAVDGSLYDLHVFGEPCKYAIQTLFGDDFAAPPKSMNITVKTESGKSVIVKIPYDLTEKAKVYINDEQI